jgi:hypothetical protein
MDDSLARVLSEGITKEKYSGEQRKVSMGASDSGDSYRKFETPRTISRFSNDKN